MVLGASNTVAANGIFGASAVCPTGDIAIAGGALIDPTVSTANLTLVTLDSYNQGLFSGTTPNDIWIVDMKNPSPTPQSFQVQATCAPAISVALAPFAKPSHASSLRSPRP
jgi:hypothetical protein